MFEEEDLTKLINESLKKARPGVIALSGSWGCGKTYLLNRVLNNINLADKFALIAVHNAWEDDFSGKPIIPALFKLAQKLDTTVYPLTDEQIKEKCAKNRGRIAKFLASLIRCIPGCGEVPAGIAGLLEAVNGSHEGEPNDDQVLQSNPVFTNVRGWSDVYTEFGRICDEPSLSNYKKILVIDDLDRVLPTRQMDLLESLHHLAERVGVLVIVAFDPDQLQQTVKTYYGEQVEVDRYLEKIFNGTLQIQDNDCSDTLDLLVSIIGPRTNYYGPHLRNRLSFLLGPVQPTRRNQIKLIQAIKYYADSLESNEYLALSDWLTILVWCMFKFCKDANDKKWGPIRDAYKQKFRDDPFVAARPGDDADATKLFYRLRLCVFDHLDAKIEIADKNIPPKKEGAAQ